MKIKLKRCPFCGSTAGLYESYDGMYVVQCNYCSIGTIHMRFAAIAVHILVFLALITKIMIRF